MVGVQLPLPILSCSKLELTLNIQSPLQLRLQTYKYQRSNENHKLECFQHHYRNYFSAALLLWRRIRSKIKPNSDSLVGILRGLTHAQFTWYFNSLGSLLCLRLSWLTRAITLVLDFHTGWKAVRTAQMRILKYFVFRVMNDTEVQQNADLITIWTVTGRLDERHRKLSRVHALNLYFLNFSLISFNTYSDPNWSNRY